MLRRRRTLDRFPQFRGNPHNQVLITRSLAHRKISQQISCSLEPALHFNAPQRTVNASSSRIWSSRAPWNF
jgi:hypothetical protein